MKTFLNTLRSQGRIGYLKIVIAVAFIAGFLLSVPLWVSTRFYPLTPVLNIFPAIPFPVDYIYFFVLLLLLVAIIFLPKPRIAIAVFAVLFVVLALLDQSRWQPWAYQYLFMLIGLGLFSWQPGDARGENNALNISRIIVASTYVWSGIQKMNLSFVTGVFPWLAGPLVNIFPSIVALGVFVPFIECAIGIGLFTKKYRTVAVWAAIAMHLSILLALGPWALNWNSVVWPWQIGMIFFVLLLFYKMDFTFASLFSNDNFVFSKVVLVLFLVMPLFNFFGVWDAYLSDSLYSGNVSQGVIYMDSAVRNKLPPAVARYVKSYQSSIDRDTLTISDWSLGEMNVPPYPETRIYKNVARYICGYANNPSEVSLAVQEKPTWPSNIAEEKNYDCSDL